MPIPSEDERVKCLLIGYNCGNKANMALKVKLYKSSSVKTSTFTSYQKQSTLQPAQ